MIYTFVVSSKCECRVWHCMFQSLFFSSMLCVLYLYVLCNRWISLLLRWRKLWVRFLQILMIEIITSYLMMWYSKELLTAKMYVSDISLIAVSSAIQWNKKIERSAHKQIFCLLTLARTCYFPILQRTWGGGAPSIPSKASKSLNIMDSRWISVQSLVWHKLLNYPSYFSLILC